MDVEQLALLAGILFILIAVVGGGFTIREVTIPSVPGWGRAVALVIGLLFVGPFFWSRLPVAPSERTPGTDTRLTAIYSDDGPVRSAHGIGLSQIEVRARRPQPRVGDRVQISFILQNIAERALTFQETFVAARSPSGENRDFGYGHERLTIEPDDTVRVKATLLVDAPGVWQLWPCYILGGGTEEDYCPTQWREFPIRVVR